MLFKWFDALLLMADWEKKYRHALAGAEDKIKNSKPFICAYNTNIDLVADFGKLRELFIPVKMSDKGCIESPEDFFAGLMHCMKKNIGAEWLVKNKRTFGWLKNNLQGEHKLGGDAGITAHILSKLGAEAIVNVASPTKEQKELFCSENIKLPRTVSGESMIHFIVEYRKGDCLEGVRAKANNRFIATYDPLNSGLAINESFRKSALKNIKKAGKVFLSGYHLLGKNYRKGICESLKQIKTWKEKNPKLFIHAEFGDIEDKGIRTYVAENIFNNVDSVGMDEDELRDILSLYNPGLGAVNALNIYNGGKFVFEKFRLKRLNIHTENFALTFTKGNPENEQSALLLGALTSGTRAATGGSTDLKGLKKMNRTLKVSSEGMGEEELLRKKYNFVDGIYRAEGFNAVFVPTKKVKNPVNTVGLGDAFNAGVLAGL